MKSNKEVLIQWFEEKQIAYKTLSLGTFASNSELGHAYAKGKGSDCYYCIVINKKIGIDGFTARCIMWHEFCHCWDYSISRSMGHGMKWFKKLIRKPIYAVGVVVLFPIVIYRLCYGN